LGSGERFAQLPLQGLSARVQRTHGHAVRHLRVKQKWGPQAEATIDRVSLAKAAKS